MERFTKVRGKEGWINFIKTHALRERANVATMNDYIIAVAKLAGHPEPHDGIPSLREAIRSLIKEGKIEPFTRQRNTIKVAATKPLSAREGNSSIVEVLAGVAELHTRSNQLLRRLLLQVQEVSEQMSILFGSHQEMEMAKKRIEAALKEVDDMDEQFGGVLWKEQ